MKKVTFTLCLLVLQSCNYFQVEKVSKARLVEDQIETLNWEDVDNYPSFAICDSVTEKVNKRACFETEFSNHIFNSLNEAIIIVEDDIDETIYLDLLISEKGIASIHKNRITKKTRQIIPNIDTLILKSIKRLPKIYPAIKRGQQVKTQFTLPIQIKVNGL